MRRTMKQELKASMDQLHFSQETKEDMVKLLMSQSKEIPMKKKTTSGRRLLFIALAAAIALVTLTGAALFTRWSRSAQTRYNPSEDIKIQAERSGLSVMLEETKGAENHNEVLSVTDQGITITAVQSIVDNYGAEITFRVEGFELPEGEDPSAWPTVTIDGEEFGFSTSQGGGFFDGTTRNEEGEWVYASTGEPVKSRDDKFHSAILDWVADDGSMEYTHYITFHEKDGRYLGKEIVFTFDSFIIQGGKGGTDIPYAEGNWELRWILTGTGDSITVEPNAQIGDSDVILLDAEIGQKTIYTRYQVDDYWEGWNQLVELPQAVDGVRMKDGSQHLCMVSTSGFEDQENMIYFTECSMFDAILDVSQVESLMFHKGWEKDANGDPTVQTFYYIPIA